MQRRGKRERVQRTQSAPGTPFDHGVFEIIEEDVNGAAAAQKEAY
jgi:hypothetical protein